MCDEELFGVSPYCSALNDDVVWLEFTVSLPYEGPASPRRIEAIHPPSFPQPEQQDGAEPSPCHRAHPAPFLFPVKRCPLEAFPWNGTCTVSVCRCISDKVVLGMHWNVQSNIAEVIKYVQSLLLGLV